MTVKVTSLTPFSKKRSPFSKIRNFSAPAGEKIISSAPAEAPVEMVKAPEEVVRLGVVTEVAKVGLATVAMVALVVPVIEILVPAVKSEAILDQLGAPAPPEIRT